MLNPILHVKICGLTNLADSLAAIQAGADLLGFNFYSLSPRAITPALCERLLLHLRPVLADTPQPVLLVGVFVNQPANEILSILDGCGLDLAQLSGDESPAVLSEFGGRAYKALRSVGGQSLEDLARSYLPSSGKTFPSNQPAFLVDASAPGQHGGTGQIADWSQAHSLAQHLPLLLAGGITPENAARAVQQVRPWGIDVASGVESAPGKKDSRKMHQLIAQARTISIPNE